jgi:hypothetical protein
MIIDLAATTGFGDESGLKNFFLVHRFIHDQTAAALTAKFNIAASSFGIFDSNAETEWLKVMKEAKPGQRPPQALSNWLKVHADIHVATYGLLGQSPTTAPDLSLVDFGDQEQFYDWMYAHQQMHDFEQASLGLT